MMFWRKKDIITPAVLQAIVYCNKEKGDTHLTGVLSSVNSILYHVQPREKQFRIFVSIGNADHIDLVTIPFVDLIQAIDILLQKELLIMKKDAFKTSIDLSDFMNVDLSNPETLVKTIRQDHSKLSNVIRVTRIRRDGLQGNISEEDYQTAFDTVYDEMANFANKLD